MLDQPCGSEQVRAVERHKHGGNATGTTALPQAFRSCLERVSRSQIKPLREMPTGRLREKVIVTRQIVDSHALAFHPGPAWPRSPRPAAPHNEEGGFLLKCLDLQENRACCPWLSIICRGIQAEAGRFG